jgi:hypothetical protein
LRQLLYSSSECRILQKVRQKYFQDIFRILLALFDRHCITNYYLSTFYLHADSTDLLCRLTHVSPFLNVTSSTVEWQKIKINSVVGAKRLTGDTAFDV